MAAKLNESSNNSDVNQPSNGSDASKLPLLGLKIPKQSPPPADSMLLDLKETEAWFETLPMANIGETARRVFSTLVEFNRIELPDLLRAKIIEKFRPPVEYIINNLQRHYVDVGLPLSPKGWKTASLARELLKELANSYKIIIERMVAGKSENFDRRLLVIALHRALFYLGETLTQCALIYVAWPEGIWREINNIYAYASQNNVHQVPVKPDDTKDAGSLSTIEDTFKSLMLFSSATPRRLRQSHVRLLYSRLLEWSHYTEILTKDDGGTSLGRFNVDLWSDSAPMHNSLRTPIVGRRVAILDVRELLKKLRSDFEQAPWETHAGLQSAKPTVTRPLLRLLIMAWSRPPDRRFVRTKLNFDLHVVAGLHAVHGNLLAMDERPYATTRAPLFTLDETEPKSRHRKPQWSAGSLEQVSLAPLDSELTSDSILIDSTLLTPVEQTPPPQPQAEEKPREPLPNETASHTVTTINESAGGYCIRWHGLHIPRVKIGELIGIESPSDHRKYGLGVIRWMKLLDDHGLDLGLEVIATRCGAADVREASADVKRKRAPAYKCLVINDTDPSSNATASLVMSTMSLQTGVDLLLTLDSKEHLIRLTKLVEFNSAFARYHFVFVETEQEESSDEDERPGDEFSDLWGNL